MIELRPYQNQSVDSLREGIRAGHKQQILCAPTGAGKTICGAYLMSEALNKGSRAAFLVDRVALVGQTSRTFDDFGIPHGVMQANHWRARPWERAQIVSAQTLARRDMPHKPQLLIVDESHTLFKSTIDFIRSNPDIVVIGLSATPFTKGIGKIYSRVVNVTTTDKLIEEGFLAPVRPYAAKRIDLTGVRTKFDGEWDDAEVEARSLTIVGDVVQEWTAKTLAHFGGPVKTIVFSATVAHGEELCRQFQEAGHNFQQVSYKDGGDESRQALIDEFRKPNSEIVGLVSCEALAKGFDVPDILCGISCRPYRKSLSSHIQQLGRVMRSHPGKTHALWLCHSGNYVRFLEDMAEFFGAGVNDLDEHGLDSRVRKEPEEKDNDYACGQCKLVMPMSATHCPACGWERPRRKNTIQNVSGEMIEIGTPAKREDWLQDKGQIWREIVGYALSIKPPDKAEKFALAQYRNIYGAWPKYAMRNITPAEPTDRLIRKVKQGIIRWSKSRAAA